MLEKKRRVSLFLALSLLLLPGVTGMTADFTGATVAPGGATAAQSATPDTTGWTAAFVGARVIDGTGRPPVESATLIVRDGRVVSVGPSAQVPLPAGSRRIDVAGRTIVPGLINAHGHVGETKGLRSGPELYDEANVRRHLGLYARYGVTTVFSLGGDQAAGFRVRDEQARNPTTVARIFVAGPVLTPGTAEEARVQVDAAAALRPDLLKIRVDDNLGTTPKMSPEVYGAVIARARERGLRVAAHVYYLEDAKGVLRAGADFIAHSVRDRAVDDELVDLLKERDACLCPTLLREVSTFVYESEPAFFADPFFLRDAEPEVMAALRDPKRQAGVRESRSARQYKKALEMAKRNLKTLVERGVPIAFGTDTGPPARFQGYFEHLELEQMAEAGLSPWQVLASATRDAAKCMKVAGELGTLEPGARADFLVLRKNPLEDVRNSRTLESVWMGGTLVPSR
jgi:imidazolonepropionase-like amidohydrolase